MVDQDDVKTVVEGKPVCADCKHMVPYTDSHLFAKCSAAPEMSPVSGKPEAVHCSARNMQGDCPHFEKKAYPPAVALNKLPWHKRLAHRVKFKFGWRDCPNCRQFAHFSWEKEWVHHPEEPPLFVYYVCGACGWRTKTMPSWLTESAVRSLGYQDFEDYAVRGLKIEPRESDGQSDD